MKSIRETGQKLSVQAAKFDTKEYLFRCALRVKNTFSRVVIFMWTYYSSIYRRCVQIIWIVIAIEKR